MVSNGGIVQNPPTDYPHGDAQGLESHKYSQAAGPYWLAEAIKVHLHTLTSQVFCLRCPLHAIFPQHPLLCGMMAAVQQDSVHCHGTYIHMACANFMQASPHYTSDLDSATAVLAYDYCHMSWLVAAGFGGECLQCPGTLAES